MIIIKCDACGGDMTHQKEDYIISMKMSGAMIPGKNLEVSVCKKCYRKVMQYLKGKCDLPDVPTPKVVMTDAVTAELESRIDSQIARCREETPRAIKKM